MANIDDPKSRQTGPQFTYLIALIAALGGFLFGYDLNIIGAAMIYLREQFTMSPWLFGFSTGSAIFGCIFGPFLAMFLGNPWGRKRCLFLAAALFFVSAVGSAFPETLAGVTGDPVWGFNIYRILGGVGIGLSSVLAPMYIAEIAPAERRGRLVLMYQLAITIGAMLGFLFTAACANWIADTNLNWRWMFGSEALPAVLFAILLIMVPRSPRWLAEKGLDDESLKVLTRVNGPQRAGEILREIRESIDAESGRFSELFKPGIRYALLIACILAVFANWTGWSSIAYYLPTLMQMGGYPDPADAISSSLALFLLNMLLTFVAIATVDRWGRKKTLDSWFGMDVFFYVDSGIYFLRRHDWPDRDCRNCVDHYSARHCPGAFAMADALGIVSHPYSHLGHGCFNHGLVDRGLGRGEPLPAHPGPERKIDSDQARYCAGGKLFCV